ncbi:hypothetical protein PENSPDRAFT_695367 [Peniophora sp. CONT]|nr:hypothetical protein PENSPDRAFT_695367 [Peniophora sp. CONT]
MSFPSCRMRKVALRCIAALRLELILVRAQRHNSLGLASCLAAVVGYVYGFTQAGLSTYTSQG